MAGSTTVSYVADEKKKAEVIIDTKLPPEKSILTEGDVMHGVKEKKHSKPVTPPPAPQPKIECVSIVSPKEIHECARNHGWWPVEGREIPELLCLIHSEISEALEAYRNHIKEGQSGCLGEELADAIIRIFDMCEALNINIIEEVSKKHKYNLERPFRHGNKKC